MNNRRGKYASAFFADNAVGLEAVKYVLEMHPDHIKCIVTICDNEIAHLARSFGCPVVYFHEITEQSAEEVLSGVDYLFLAWWPKIVPPYILTKPNIGVVNFHPSLLPYNRGKHYNFWTLVEETPFGVTLHFADDGIDTGDILFQSTIEKSWEDTGGSLYRKAIDSMIALFKEKYVDIIEGRYKRIPQDKGIGKLHYASELDPASQIFLDRTYSARELINLLRARTFPGKPACSFIDNNVKYEVRIMIKEIKNES